MTPVFRYATSPLNGCQKFWQVNSQEVLLVSCDWARKLIVLADGLTREEREDLERHLSQCPSCAAKYREWQYISALLSRLPTLSSTREERAELLDKLSRVSPAPDLDCVTAQAMVWFWIDDDLSPQEKSSLMLHLATCDRCQSALWQAEQTVQLLRSLPRLKASAAEKEVLKAKLRQMSKRTIAPFLWRVALPIAAAAVLVLAIIAQWHTTTGDRHFSTTSTYQPTMTPSVKSTKIEPKRQSSIALKVVKGPSKPQQPTRQPKVAARLSSREPNQLQVSVKQRPKSVRAAEGGVKPKAQGLILPEPPEFVQNVASQLSTGEPIIVAEEPKFLMLAETVMPALPQPSANVPSPVVSSERMPTPQLAQESPVVSSPSSQPRQLIELPPVTVEGDISLQPPRVKLTVIPPSQRLYQKSGVALVAIPPEERPVRVTEEQALAPDLSIPLAAERYRSHTASIPILRYSISW